MKPKKSKYKDHNSNLVQEGCSFWDKLISVDVDMGSANLEAEVMDFDESEIEVIKIGPFPIIRFSDDLEQKLAKTGNRSITIKLLGKKIDFNTLQLRLFLL